MATNDEIDAIMNDIQSLQKGMAEAASAPPVAQSPQKIQSAPAPQSASVPQAAKIVEPEPTLQILKQVQTVEPKVAPAPMTEAINEIENLIEEASMPEQTTEKKNAGSMTMVLEGDMTLKLRYELDGQEVSIGFADHFLTVQLADGTEFKVPVRSTQSSLKAA